MDNIDNSKIITFYSFKGGTGRTMALVNTAFLLSNMPLSKKGVLIIDWDLESPGLQYYFKDKQNNHVSSEIFTVKPGLIDLFISIESSLSKQNFSKPNDPTEFFQSLSLSKYITSTKHNNIHILHSGKMDTDYTSKVNSFEWDELYNNAPWIFLSFAEYLSTFYDFILIDSRTGLTDTSGICTTLMPEKLVLVFTPNKQSISGLLELIPNAVKYRTQSDDFRPLIVFPLPSRIEITEPSLRDAWRYGDQSRNIQGYQPLFEDILEKTYNLPECKLQNYFNDVQIQHVPSYAYGEEIAVNIEQDMHDKLTLSSTFNRFTNRLVNRMTPWTELSTDYDQLEKPDTTKVFSYLVDLKLALKNSTRNAKESVHNFLNSYYRILDSQRLNPEIETEMPFDEQVITNIHSFIGYRDLFIDFINSVCLYEVDNKYYDELIFEFFEKSISFLHPPKNTTRWNDIWYDNYRFILHELYLYTIAILIEHKKFDTIDTLVDNEYYFETNIDREYATFIVFNEYVSSLDETRNKRLKLNRSFLTSDLIKQRATTPDIPFDHLMQADFILCLRAGFYSKNSFDYWVPRTIVYASEYHSSGFELFFKARSKRNFYPISRLLKVSDEKELKIKYEQSTILQELEKPRSRFLRPSFKGLMNWDNLNTA